MSDAVAAAGGPAAGGLLAGMRVIDLSRLAPGGRHRAAPDATAGVLAQAGLSDEEPRAVAEDARRDGASGFKGPPD